MDTSLDDMTTEPFSGGPGTAGPGRQARVGGIWAGTRATFGALLGLAPHVLHHIGFLAGAAVLTGVLGNLVLYAVGMLLSIPMLIRLRRRFGSWKAPVLGVAAFTALFALSAFVIGPAISQGLSGPVPGASSEGLSQPRRRAHRPPPLSPVGASTPNCPSAGGGVGWAMAGGRPSRRLRGSMVARA